MKQSHRQIGGMLLILLGGWLLLDQFGLSGQVWQSFSWVMSMFWPAILVWWGYLMTQRKKTKIGGRVLVGLGGLLLVANWWDMSFWKLFWPAVIVYAGISLLKPNN